MEARGFVVRTAESVAEGLAAIAREAPAFAVIDMRMSDGNGLDVMSELKAKRPDARAIILTGYGNIVTAVTAVKLGAFDYLAKPADADEIYGALMATRHDKAEVPEKSECRPTASAGSTSNGSMNSAAAMSRKTAPAVSTCTGAPCSAFSPSARRALTDGASISREMPQRCVIARGFPDGSIAVRGFDGRQDARAARMRHAA